MGMDKWLAGFHFRAALLSVFIPGAGQMAKGRIGSGIAFLFFALVIGIPTAGLGWILVGLLSASLALIPACICSNCRMNVSWLALSCRNCGAVFASRLPTMDLILEQLREEANGRRIVLLILFGAVTFGIGLVLSGSVDRFLHGVGGMLVPLGASLICAGVVGLIGRIFLKCTTSTPASPPACR
jgi:hypothetical protein